MSHDTKCEDIIFTLDFCIPKYEEMREISRDVIFIECLYGLNNKMNGQNLSGFIFVVSFIVLKDEIDKELPSDIILAPFFIDIK